MFNHILARGDGARSVGTRETDDFQATPRCIPDPYHYTFRLFQFVPQPVDGTGLHLEFNLLAFDPGSSFPPPYCALSYECGDPTAAKQCVLIDNELFAMGQNLFDSLKSFRQLIHSGGLDDNP